MRLFRHSILAIFGLLVWSVASSGVFASAPVVQIHVSKTVVNFAAETVKPTMKNSVLPDSSTSGTSEDADTLMERQKTYDNMNALLIQSYKTKLDKILSDVYSSVENVAKEDPALQAAILERIAEEIDAKIANLEKQTISPNRKKILLSIF